MKEYKGIEYPDLKDAIEFYNTPSDFGGFNKHERVCKHLLVRMPNPNINLSIDNIDREKLFSDLFDYKGKLPESLKNTYEAEIDKVCKNYIDAIQSGELSI